ncbi:hypothetical protein EV182_005523, partial [Spiromyces aspiralis]
FLEIVKYASSANRVIVSNMLTSDVTDFNETKTFDLSEISRGANVMGYSDTLGSINVGKSFDTLAIDLDGAGPPIPLVDITSTLMYIGTRDNTIQVYIDDKLVHN